MEEGARRGSLWCSRAPDLYSRPPCSNWTRGDFDEGGRVCIVRKASFLGRSDEHIGEGSWGVCNPQKGTGMACTDGTSWVYFLQCSSKVGLLDTRPQEWAKIVYLWCPPIHLSIHCSHLWERSSNLSVSPPICTRTLPRCREILPKVSKHSYHQWWQASSMANDRLCCRALLGLRMVHCLVARPKDLCFYITICKYLRLWDRSLYFRPI